MSRFIKCFRRECVKCQEYFTPSGKKTRVCDDCRAVSKLEGERKRQAIIDRKKLERLYSLKQGEVV